MSQNVIVYKVYLSLKNDEGEIAETLESIDMARISAEQTASVLIKSLKCWRRTKVLKCQMSNDEIKAQWEEWGEQDATNQQPQNDNVPLPFLKAYKRGYKKGKVD